MIKQDASGKYYSSLDVAASFSTFEGAATHEAYQRIIGENQRPDSRTELQKIEASSWTVPRAKAPSALDRLEASLRKNTDPAYKVGLSPEESLLLHIKALKREQQDAEDRAADEAAWLAKPLIAGGLIEAQRLLAEAENDFTRDRAEVVKAEQLVAALSTVNADEGWIRSQLRSLLGVEEARKLAVREAAHAELTAAQSKVNALGAAQQVAVRVPVEGGDDLLSRGNSYTSNLLAAGAPPEQLAAAFAAMDSAFAGDTAALVATLEANEGSDQ